MALGLAGSGAVLFGTGALGLLAAWATVVAVFLLAGGALVLAIAMEADDLTEPQPVPVIARLSPLPGPDVTG